MLEHLKDQIGCHESHLARGRTDGRKARCEHFREWKVTESHQRYPLRYGDACSLCCKQSARSKVVVSKNDGVSGGATRRQRFECLAARMRGLRRCRHEVQDVTTVFAHDFGIAIPAFDRAQIACCAVLHERNPAIASFQKMPRCHTSHFGM